MPSPRVIIDLTTDLGGQYARANGPPQLVGQALLTRGSASVDITHDHNGHEGMKTDVALQNRWLI